MGVVVTVEYRCDSCGKAYSPKDAIVPTFYVGRVGEAGYDSLAKYGDFCSVECLSEYIRREYIREGR